MPFALPRRARLRSLLSLLAVSLLSCASTKRQLDAVDVLPQADPRLPWSNALIDVRYRPGGDGAALNVSQFDVMLAAPYLQRREDSLESPIPIESGIQIVRWSTQDPDPHVEPGSPPGKPDGRGAWSRDGEFYAHLFTAEPRILWGLWVYSASRHEWGLLIPGVSRFPVSNPTWLGDRGEVSVFALTEPRAASSMIVASVDGGVTRQAQIEGFPGDIGGAKISASPDGRMIAVVAWRQITEETSMWILDANTLVLLGSMQLESHGAMMEPQWDASSSRIALTTRGALFVIAIGDDGRPQRATKVKGLPPRPKGAVWVPGEQSLLVFACEHAPDVVEFAQHFTKPVDSVEERQIYSTWRYDVPTQQLEECTDLRVVVRGSWYPRLVPRVGEAFAAWEQ